MTVIELGRLSSPNVMDFDAYISKLNQDGKDTKINVCNSILGPAQHSLTIRSVIA